MTGTPCVEVHWARLDLGSDPPAGLWRLLAAGERARARRIASRRRMREFVGARAWVRRILAGRTGGAPARLPLPLDGAPAPLGETWWSLAHAAGVAALAVADAPVGIDIEASGELGGVDGEDIARLIERSLPGRRTAASSSLSRWLFAEAEIKLVASIGGLTAGPVRVASGGSGRPPRDPPGSGRTTPARPCREISFSALSGGPGVAGVLATGGPARIVEYAVVDAWTAAMAV